MSAYLLLSIRIPEADTDVDPEQAADDLLALINKERIEKCDVGLFPACQWLTQATLARLRETAAQMEAEG